MEVLKDKKGEQSQEKYTERARDKREETGPVMRSQGEFASTSGDSLRRQRGRSPRAAQDVCLKGLTYFLCARVHIHNVNPCLHEETGLRT